MNSRNGVFIRNVIIVVKACRKAKGIKQSGMALALNMSECNYSKIESHFKELTTGQLNIIGEALGISARKIISLAEAIELIDFNADSPETFVICIQQKCNYSLLEDYQNDSLLEILSNVKGIENAKNSQSEFFDIKHSK